MTVCTDPLSRTVSLCQILQIRLQLTIISNDNFTGHQYSSEKQFSLLLEQKDVEASSDNLS